MSPPAAPVTPTSRARSKKPKKPTGQPAKASAKAAAAAAASSSDAEDRIIAHEKSIDPTLAYAPPPGSVPADIDIDVDFGEFDYDAVKADEGAELWLVRAPTVVRSVPLLSPPRT